MRVEIGNTSPHDCATDESGAHVHVPRASADPVVTYLNIPEGEGGYDLDPDLDVRDVALHLMANPSGVTHLPGAEALLVVLAQDGAWRHHSGDKPSWVWSDNPDFQRILAEFYGCAEGRPSDLELTHHTLAGPAGVGYPEAPE